MRMTDEGPPDPADITGLILAGGAGRRAGGRDKGLVRWRGEPLAQQVARRLRPQCAELLVSCNRNFARYAEYGSVVRDEITGYQGPLAGLHSAARRIRTPLTLVCPCDVPGVPDDLGAKLASALAASGARIAYARAGGRRHYCCALLVTSCLATLEEFMAGGGRAVRVWYALQGAVAVDFPGAEDAFRNLNIPG